MKRGIALLAFGAALSMSMMAAEVTGYVIDEKCATKPTMKGDTTCAKKCIDGGAQAVLAGDDGKVYKVDKEHQDQLAYFAGKKVTVQGTIDGDNMKVSSMKENQAGCVLGPTGCQ
jgi:hypothetical protein